MALVSRVLGAWLKEFSQKKSYMNHPRTKVSDL